VRGLKRPTFGTGSRGNVFLLCTKSKSLITVACFYEACRYSAQFLSICHFVERILATYTIYKNACSRTHQFQQFYVVSDAFGFTRLHYSYIMNLHTLMVCSSSSLLV
jgi:hypothetical protein